MPWFARGKRGGTFSAANNGIRSATAIVVDRSAIHRRCLRKPRRRATGVLQVAAHGMAPPVPTAGCYILTNSQEFGAVGLAQWLASREALGAQASGDTILRELGRGTWYA
jgi:hypothetical protein